jgi:hypothetical protein
MRWTVARAVVALFLAASLAGCDDGGGSGVPRPTRSPTIQLPTPTRTAASPSPSDESPGASEQPSDEASEQPSDEASELPTDEASEESSEQPSEESSEQPSEESSEQPSEESSEPADTPTDGDQADDDATPRWLWWLLAVLVLGAVVGIPLLIRARRRSAWRQELSAAEAELGWVARELLPGLRRVGSREQVAGGWAVGLPRVTAAEDQLTVLEASAPDEAGRERARALRDASRLARGRMEQLIEPGPHDTWALDLDAIMADLEAALGPPRVAPA